VLRVAPLLAVALAAAAAAAAALIVAPAPSRSLALVAIAASEKSAVIALAALGAIALAIVTLGLGPAARPAPWLAIGLAVAAAAIALLPIIQARRLAVERGVRLDFGRYLFRSRIDTEGPGQPQVTVEYATVDGGRRLGLDVYTPARRPARPSRPVLVVHGGFWSAGEKGEAALFSRWLADRGYTVFDVQYRTAPQPNWKTATGDLRCAIGWVKGHPTTPDWSIDPSKLTLLGRSAGGHLALMAAYAADDPVESAVALYAPTDLVWAYAHAPGTRVVDQREKLRAFLGGPPESTGGLYAALSPVEQVTPAAPRTLLVHGGRDQFLPAEHMRRLAERLRAAGVLHDTLYIPYAQHACDFVLGGLSGQLIEAALVKFLGGSQEPDRA
jgi:acetyl esterase/lipase